MDLAVAADRSLPRPVIEAAVDAAAPACDVLWHLEQALAGDPAALILGGPPVAGALAAELAARGSATLAVPACAACGRTGKPLFRGDRGGVCQRCRAWQTAEPCAGGGKTKPVAVRTATGEPLCEMCRRWSGRARRECGTCGKTATIAVRGRDGRPGICVNCYRLPEATCAACGRRRQCNFAATARPVCPSCSPKATATCARCGQDRPPQARWPEGPVCDPCYTAALRLRGQCASCGQTRRLVAPPGPDAVTCSDCAGIPATHACADCGMEDKLYERGRCDRCSLRRRTMALLAGPGSQVPRRAASRARGDLRGPQPENRRSTGCGEATARRCWLTWHPGRCPPLTRRWMPTRAAAPLTSSATCSPPAACRLPRDEELTRTGQWLDGVIESVQPAAARRVARAYATWQVMPLLRVSAGRAARPRTYTAHAHRNVRAAASFLAWLDGRGRALGSLPGGRHRLLARHRPCGLPSRGLPVLGRRSRALSGIRPARPGAGHRPRGQPGRALGAGRPPTA